MSQKKTTTVEKNVENKSLDNVNLDAILKQIESAKVKEKSDGLSRASLYKYSDEELQRIKKDKDEGKKIRNQTRKRTDYFMHSIAGAAKRKEESKLKSLITEFVEFYKNRFLRNDFSLSSLRESKSLDENSTLIFTASLEIIKMYVAKEK